MKRQDGAYMTRAELEAEIARLRDRCRQLEDVIIGLSESVELPSNLEGETQ